jgi:Xaa-Pro aminopeptidase
MDVLVYGDTERSPTLRHEVPVAIGDPFLYLEADGRKVVLTNALERDRIAAVLPEAELLLADQLGMFELIAAGLPRDAIELELVLRAVRHAGVTAALVPGELPVVVADHLRASGIELTVDAPGFAARRRAKTGAELESVLRAQRAAEAGMAAAERTLRAARVEGDALVREDGSPLTAEHVRAALRAACAEHGASAPPDVLVTTAWSGGGHDPGSGPLPADLPVTVDLWPRDEAGGCHADMTRTFVVGAVLPEVAAAHAVVVEALAAARALVRPGVTGREVYDAAAQVVEDAGHPTVRTRAAGETLTHGFYFGLGHGVGLDVHEAPLLSLAGRDPLVAGDVIALEPGIEGMPFGGARVEDLLLVTEAGSETLTAYPYDLQP